MSSKAETGPPYRGPGLVSKSPAVKISGGFDIRAIPPRAAPAPMTHDVAAAARAIDANQLSVAEELLRKRLAVAPNDALALQMMGEIAGRVGRFDVAEALFHQALAIAPNLAVARFKLAVTLHTQTKDALALAQVLKLRLADPAHPDYRVLEAAIRSNLGDHAQSLKLHEDLFAQGIDGPRIRMLYGHTLKTLGRPDESAAAYRRFITSKEPEDKPLLGEAWWALANLKNSQLDAEDVKSIQAALRDPTLSEDSRTHLHYALGAAYDDLGDAEAAFTAYAAGAALRRRRDGYIAASTTQEARRAMAVFTRTLLDARQGQGAPPPDPIFIVGLPRSGSTLLEQILATHPKVEGTMELAELPSLGRELGGKSNDDYPEVVERLTAGDLRALGEAYLSRTRIYRKTGRPFFIDKIPNNWMYVGLIRLILPNAKIIDARRHPFGSCLSTFKQLFRVGGQNFSYSLSDLGKYYRDYVELMDHMDLAAPGAVHRVIYEDIIQNTEVEVRRLLDYCGLEFDPACLRFHETQRAVRTPSAEQVRRPIYRDSLEAWRAYEAHLGPLKTGLGPALENWRGADGGQAAAV